MVLLFSTLWTSEKLYLIELWFVHCVSKRFQYRIKRLAYSTTKNGIGIPMIFYLLCFFWGWGGDNDTIQMPLIQKWWALAEKWPFASPVQGCSCRLSHWLLKFKILSYIIRNEVRPRINEMGSVTKGNLSTMDEKKRFTRKPPLSPLHEKCEVCKRCHCVRCMLRRIHNKYSTRSCIV